MFLLHNSPPCLKTGPASWWSWGQHNANLLGQPGWCVGHLCWGKHVPQIYLVIEARLSSCLSPLWLLVTCSVIRQSYKLLSREKSENAIFMNSWCVTATLNFWPHSISGFNNDWQVHLLNYFKGWLRTVYGCFGVLLNISDLFLIHFLICSYTLISGFHFFVPLPFLWLGRKPFHWVYVPEDFWTEWDLGGSWCCLTHVSFT